METKQIIVSSRLTLDGVRVFIHSDGAIADRCNFLRNRVKRDLWRFVGEICTLNYSELETAIKAWNRPAKAGVR
jgi:hypothetical protein